MAYLQGAGVRLHRTGSTIRLGLMTDKDVHDLAQDREITEPYALDLKTNEPVKGGLFDLSLTGGTGGGRWGKITLAEPVINPLMKQHVARVLGLKDAELDELYQSDDGPAQIEQRLKSLDIPKEIKRHRQGVAETKGTERNAHIKALRLLTGLQKNDQPADSLMIRVVPVVPPRFRPVAVQKGVEMTSHANLVYADLIHANQHLKDLRQDTQDVRDERRNLEQAVTAAVGLGEPINPDNRKNQVSGLLGHVFGRGSPKLGDFQRKVLGTTVNTTGRGVIAPDDQLDVDEAGIPEDMAWATFQPQIMRRLVQTSAGTPKTELAKMLERRDPAARKALEHVLQTHPVVMVSSGRAQGAGRQGSCGGRFDLKKARTPTALTQERSACERGLDRLVKGVLAIPW